MSGQDVNQMILFAVIDFYFLHFFLFKQSTDLEANWGDGGAENWHRSERGAQEEGMNREMNSHPDTLTTLLKI